MLFFNVFFLTSVRCWKLVCLIQSVHGMHCFMVTLWEDTAVFLHTNDSWKCAAVDSGFRLKSIGRIFENLSEIWNCNKYKAHYSFPDKLFALIQDTHVTVKFKWVKILSKVNHATTWPFETLLKCTCTLHWDFGTTDRNACDSRCIKSHRDSGQKETKCSHSSAVSHINRCTIRLSPGEASSVVPRGNDALASH